MSTAQNNAEHALWWGPTVTCNENSTLTTVHAIAHCKGLLTTPNGDMSHHLPHPGPEIIENYYLTRPETREV